MKIFIDKSKKTKKERYNDEYYNNRPKHKRTKLKNHGNENFNNREQAKITVNALYGVNSISQIESVKIKKKKTKLDKYGDENYNNTEKRKQTCLIKYNVEHVKQNTDIQDKSSKNSYKLKEYNLPSGKMVKIQGYENLTLDILLKTFDENNILITNKEIEKQIGQIWYEKDGKQHRYYPDLYIKSINKIVETKSAWTYEKQLQENILKKERCLNMGLNFEFMIFDSKKNIVSEII